MNTSLRMILVLGLIAAIAAGLLAGVNVWTGPIIEENTAIRLQNTLARVIDADDFIEQEGTEFRLWHAEKGGNLVGYVVRLTGQGYSSSGIDILVGLNTEAVVKGVHIFSHTETPGLGDKIEAPGFLGQFNDLGLEDPIASGPDGDVDSITGSTSSAMAVIASVRRAVQYVGRYTGLIEDQVVDLADIPDGVYTGTGRGFGGDITVEVRFSGGQLTEVKIISDNDTPGYKEPAINRIPDRMVEEQEIDVDIVSGATATSEGIIAAVRNALAQFVGGPDEPALEPVDISVLANGKYTGTADSFGGPMTVEVVISQGEIVEIIVLPHNDTPDIANPAFNTIINAIIQAQDFDVDMVSGATISCEGLIDAVQAALRSEPAIEISELEDGIYLGTADSFGGKLQVMVTVESGAVTDIEILPHDDTPDIAGPAFNNVIAQIKETQQVNVDTVSGATISADALMEAVGNALRGNPMLDVTKVPDGDYEGVGEGFYTDIKVQVTVLGGKITEITIEHEDTPDIAGPAFTTMKARVFEAQHANVDIVSGATISSEGLLEAIVDALSSSR